MRSVDWILRIEAIALFVVGVIAYLQLNGNPLWLLPKAPPRGIPADRKRSLPN